MDKSRVVDTVVMGLFANSPSGGVTYLPTPDFIEAGKFKLQKGAASMLVGSNITDVSRALSIFVAPKVISEACLHSRSGLHYRFCLRERSVYTRFTNPSEAASGP